MVIGDVVHVRGFDYVGPILETKEDKYLVDCGTCKMWMKEFELEPENNNGCYPTIRNHGKIKIKKGDSQ